MKLYLLDAGGAGLAFAALIIFIIIAVSIEAIVMLVMKYNKAGKAFLDSFLVNIASLAGGFILNSFIDDLFESGLVNLLILYVITLVIEFILLYLLNRKLPAGKTFLVCAVMNIVSYGILYLFSEGIN